MRIFVLLLLALSLVMPSLAGILPAGIKGELEIKHEDDRLDADRSLVKSKLTFKRPSELFGAGVTPYVYFEDESYQGIMAGADQKETEAAVGVDVLALSNDAVKLTLGLIYEYEHYPGGDDDALIIYKVKAAF